MRDSFAGRENCPNRQCNILVNRIAAHKSGVRSAILNADES
jgi:hypothetical protein